MFCFLLNDLLKASLSEMSAGKLQYHREGKVQSCKRSKELGKMQLVWKSEQGLMLLHMHNDTESLEDSFTTQLTDGKRTVQGTLYIYIMPVNDEISHLSSSEVLLTSFHHKIVYPNVFEWHGKPKPCQEHFVCWSAEERGRSLACETGMQVMWLPLLHDSNTCFGLIWVSTLKNSQVEK
ncbi:FRAS1-related extracellular matrix protein 1-like [Corvus hawaiiensis]|uniref:FRAS1-related extracellular matrix protein 1-like n=1 Tax=Corvus hawaiiensis TaxID=134902 RepID=UPI002018BCED|nr:FRAS1-related extracellular matrix protein 1-like [Corvus hawaiiensis]